MNNEDTGQRAAAEAIERGGSGGLSVADLLARVTSGAPATAPAAAAPPAPAPAPAPARTADDVAAVIATAAGRHLPGGQLAVDADFFDAGGTSVQAVELVAELEAELGVEFDLDEVFADARPVSLARRLLPATAQAEPVAVTPLAPAQAAPAAQTATPPPAPAEAPCTRARR
ncbi:acyl carrier protein, partial [Streptomyces anandii]|uniref:acyl carrier protein n=1 Tax=Streptomyces anandii TaxID=285454 RepID=UPI001E5DA3FD